MQINGKWCLVTGAAGGIGGATARALLERGARLVVADIDKGRVDDLGRHLSAEGGEVLSYGVDVSSETQMQQLFAWTEKETAGIEVLVNNAGILRTGGPLDTSLDDYRALFEVNFWGTLHGCQLFAPKMMERGRGAIVNVASASGIVGFAPLAAYSSSKFALVGFSEALRGEVNSRGVSVSTICPGLVNTPIADRSPLPEEEQARIRELLARRGASPEKVARAIVRAVERGEGLVHVGSDAKALAALARVAPTRAATWLAAFSKRGQNS